MKPRAEMWAEASVRLFGLLALVMLVVGAVGLLLDRLFPTRTYWFQFWKEPSKPGQAEGVSQEPSEQGYDEDPVAAQIAEVCWPWELCFWIPEGPVETAP